MHLIDDKIASVKEPAGLSRADETRPDGLILVLGKLTNLVWDVIVVDTITIFYLTSTSVTAGSAAAEFASWCREEKYAHFRNSGFRYPWSHLFEITCVSKRTRS